MRLTEQQIAEAQRVATARGAAPEELERIRQPLMDLAASHARELNALDEQTRQQTEDRNTAQQALAELDRIANAEAERDPRTVELTNAVTQAERNQNRFPSNADMERGRDVEFRQRMLWYDPQAQGVVPGVTRNQQRRRDLRILAEEATRLGVAGGGAGGRPAPAALPPPVPPPA